MRVCLGIDIIYIMRSKRGRLSRAGYAAKGPRTRAVTASRFREARSICCLSVSEAAKLLRVTERTLQNWEAGRVRIPYAAYKLMRILRGHELAHPAWRGFRVVGATLWTPEGRSFRPDHMTWWSLTCRMADEFRAMVSGRLRRAGAEGSGSGLVTTGTSDTEWAQTQQRRGFQAFTQRSSGGTLPPDCSRERGLFTGRGEEQPPGPSSNTGQKDPRSRPLAEGVPA